MIECLPRYLDRTVTHWKHQGEIQQRYGYRDFSGQPGHWQLMRWPYGRAWIGSESPSTSKRKLRYSLSQKDEVRERHRT